jgi:hypothetical protein
MMRALALAVLLGGCATVGEPRPDQACHDDCSRQNDACVATCTGLPLDCRQRCSYQSGECLHHCAAEGY